MNLNFKLKILIFWYFLTYFFGFEKNFVIIIIKLQTKFYNYPKNLLIFNFSLILIFTKMAFKNAVPKKFYRERS